MKKIIALAILVTAMCFPAMAEGFFVELGTWYVQPDNSQVFGRWMDRSDDFPIHDPVDFNFENELTWNIEFGYDTGEYGFFSFSYWDGYDESWRYDSPMNNGSTWFVPGGSNWDWTIFEIDVDAEQYEFKWGDHFGGKNRLEGTYYIGLRYSSYELNVWNQNHDNVDFDPLTDDYVIKTFDNDFDGWGFSTGISAQYEFNKKFFFFAGVDFAFVRGDEDLNYQFRYYDNGVVDEGPTMNHTYKNEIVPQVGLDLGLKFFFTDSIYSNFGYKVASWQDVGAQLPRFSRFGETEIDSSQDVNWSGFYFSLGWDFGK